MFEITVCWTQWTLPIKITYFTIAIRWRMQRGRSQVLSSDAQWQHKWQWAQTETQEAPSEHQETLFYCEGDCAPAQVAQGGCGVFLLADIETTPQILCSVLGPSLQEKNWGAEVHLMKTNEAGEGSREKVLWGVAEGTETKGGWRETLLPSTTTRKVVVARWVLVSSLK